MRERLILFLLPVVEDDKCMNEVVTNEKCQTEDDRDSIEKIETEDSNLLTDKCNCWALSCLCSCSAMRSATQLSADRQVQVLSCSAVCEWTIYTKLCLYNLMSSMIVCIYCTLLCNTSFCSNGCFVTMNCVPFWFRRSKSLYFIPYDNINFAHQKYN